MTSKRVALCLLLLVAAPLAAPVATGAQSSLPAAARLHTRTLANGLEVVVVPNNAI